MESELKNKIIEEENLLKNIFRRFKNKDFSGDTGQAMKNSSYQLAQNLIFKFGSLVFTIILARMLMPERMGLYNLALSTILLFAVFADMGLRQALMVFVSKSLGEKKYSKAKAYFKQILKWKLILILIVGLIMIPASWLIAKFIYPHKHIFFAILAGVIYIPIVSLTGFLEMIYKSANDF